MNAKTLSIKAKSFQWIPFIELSELPMGKVDRQIASQLISLGNAS